MKNDTKIRLVRHISFLNKELEDYKKFIQETEAIYREFLKSTKIYLNEKLEAEED